MKRITAAWHGEEISATFTAVAVRADYGVPGSPVWEELEDVEVDTLEILGVPVEMKALPVQLQRAIEAMAPENRDEWESME